jgi:hypothetical protein
VGQDAIEFVARALDVPLYRRIICGTALAQDSEYGGRDVKERGGVDGDETEDLYALLADVKVTQTLLMQSFSLVEHIICCSLNILTRRVYPSGPSFQTTNASALSTCEYHLSRLGLPFCEPIHACVRLAVKGCPLPL